MTYSFPDNLIELLNTVVISAQKTEFYSRKLSPDLEINSLKEFSKIPVTPISEYRHQRLVNVVSTPSDIEWIVGPYGGHSSIDVAIAEGPIEAMFRYDSFIDASKKYLPKSSTNLGVILCSKDMRYFSAEISAILIRHGIPTHVFLDHGQIRNHEVIEQIKPNILVVLSDHLIESALPESIELLITFRQSKKFNNIRQLDFFFVREFSFLGHSVDLITYELNKDLYYFEVSETGELIITTLYNQVQPMLRIQIKDQVSNRLADTVASLQLSPET